MTGEGNVIFRIDASGAAAIDRLLQRSLLSPHQLPADLADFVFFTVSTEIPASGA